tara:strand:- start:825 stop:1934 length:1110 start_codon:yes stop_codon:yes gene_type:complete
MALGLPIGLIWDNVPSPAIQPCNDPLNIEDCILWYDFTDGSTIHNTLSPFVSDQALDGERIARVDNKAQGPDRLGTFLAHRWQTYPWSTALSSSQNKVPLFETGGVNGLSYLHFDGAQANEPVGMTSNDYHNESSGSNAEWHGGYGSNATGGYLLQSTVGSLSPFRNKFSNAVINTHAFTFFVVWDPNTANINNTNSGANGHIFSFGPDSVDISGAEGGVNDDRPYVKLLYNSSNEKIRMVYKPGFNDGNAVISTGGAAQNWGIPIVNAPQIFVGKMYSGTNGFSLKQISGSGGSTVVTKTSTVPNSSPYLQNIDMDSGRFQIGTWSYWSGYKVDTSPTGHLYEMIMYNKVMSDEELECAENYLINRYL